MPTTTLRLQYGQLELLSWEGTDHGGVVRRERWVGDDGEVAHEHCHAAGRDDRSPPHRTYPVGYDARWGMCWLNAPHTAAYHEGEVQRCAKR